MKRLPDQQRADAETVDVAVARATPLDELDAQLERALGAAQELVLIQFQRLVEHADVRDGGFADTDDADLIAFDQTDLVLVAEQGGKGRRGHPAGGAAADHDHAPGGWDCHQGTPLACGMLAPLAASMWKCTTCSRARPAT
jgi:hypothetical protein